MTGMAFMVAIQASILSTGEKTYADAKKLSRETGRPIVVLVGAEWCPACKRMEAAVIPELQKKGSFKDAIYAHVDTDNDPQAARVLLQGSSIPQLVVVWKGDEGWRRQRLVGYQSVSAVDKLIQKGVKQSVALRQTDPPETAPMQGPVATQTKEVKRTETARE